MQRIGRHITTGMRRTMGGFMQSGDFPIPLIRYKFGKNTGDVAYDSSPNGNDGDIEGPSWTKGWLGPGLNFDGLDDYITVPDIGTLDEFTVLMRFYMTGRVNAFRGLFGDLLSGAWRFLSYITNGNALVFLVKNMAPSQCTATTVFDDTKYNQWYSLGMVYSSIDSLARMYINNILETDLTLTNAPTVSMTSLRLGMSHSATRRFQGIFDEFLLFDEAFTTAQMQQANYGIM